VTATPHAAREEARALLALLAAAPRPAGGPAEAAVRARCASTLRALGFDVEERPFGYSALPGRFGTSIGGVLSIAALVVASLLGARGERGGALAVLAGTGALLLFGGAWLARRGVLDAPWLRATGVNLEARRGGEAPRVWLVAHLDSKSQPVSIGLRAAGVTGTIAAWALALLALLQPAGATSSAIWIAVGAIGALAGLPVAASVVGALSPGALDDASGVATVLLAAARLPTDAEVGVLLTSAEELGLAGARAWIAEGRVPPGVALNCDGVDDVGGATCMYTRRRPARLMAAVATAARAIGAPPPYPRRLPPGILTDGVALADAGWEVVTVSRGTLRTLARIHGPKDRVERLTGVGVAETARLLAAAAGELAGAGRG